MLLRAVIDPGVLVAALLSPSGAPADLVRRWLDGAFEMVVSPQLLAELGRVLARPKFRPYVTLEEAERYLGLLARGAVIAHDPVAPQPITPDPGDDYLISLAVATGVHVLVSGDPHLTGLRDLDPPVLTPREFLGRLPG